MTHLDDNRRAVNVPTRPEPTDPLDLTALVARPGGSLRLRPIQSWALGELAETGGLLAPIGVGHGKTLISLLAPIVLGLALGRALKALLLVPAAFRGQLEADRTRYGEHFYLADPIVWSYSALSRPESATALEQLAPDLIIADEAHYLRHQESARTKRVKRYLRAKPQTGFVAMSGTITTRSVLDFSHLAEWCLGPGSPMPRLWTWLQSWAAVIDGDGQPGPADFGAVAPLAKVFAPVTSPASERSRARLAFAERLRLTRGIVSTHETSAKGTLVLRDLRLKVPAEIVSLLRQVEEQWEVPEGDCYDSPAQLKAALRQISVGFYYVWRWPSGPDWAWLDARAAWAKAVRGAVARGRSGLDSEALVREATIAGSAPTRACAEAWGPWSREREKAPPPVEAIWIDDFALVHALAWVRTKIGRIVWYQSSAVGEALAGAGLRVHGEGSAPPDDGQPCACSIRVHGAMRNLQMYSEALVMEPPASGATWEQLLGRLHRSGQTADPVIFETYQHTEAQRDALDQASRDAVYIAETQSQPQRLRLAVRTHVAPTEEG